MIPCEVKFPSGAVRTINTKSSTPFWCWKWSFSGSSVEMLGSAGTQLDAEARAVESLTARYERVTKDMKSPDLTLEEHISYALVEVALVVPPTIH